MECLKIVLVLGCRQVYKDPNHKPEMAIALRDFQALCSFVTHDELVDALKTMPELRTCVGSAQSDNLLGSMDDKKQVRLIFYFSMARFIHNTSCVHE